MNQNAFHGLFVEYLVSKGVVINYQLDEKKYSHNISEEKIKEQIGIINEFHEKTVGYCGFSNKGLRNETGRFFEENKVQFKEMNRYFEGIKNKNSINEFDEMLFDNGSYFLKLAQNSIDSINNLDYLGLIKRSMKRIEVCSGSQCAGFIKNQQLEIKDPERCCYDMVEVDMAKFLIKLKRKGIEADWSRLIKFYCELSKLEQDSSKFIMALFSYPYEVFRWIRRYKENSKNKNIDEYCRKLKIFIARDSVISN